MGPLLMVLLFVIALFLILLVLVQRGRGGGLAGALGGMGGQSAFGTKAGDLFTRITIVAAFLWIVLCAITVKFYNQNQGFDRSLGGSAQTTEEKPSSSSSIPASDKKPAGTPPSGTAESNSDKSDSAAP